MPLVTVDENELSYMNLYEFRTSKLMEAALFFVFVFF